MDTSGTMSGSARQLVAFINTDGRAGECCRGTETGMCHTDTLPLVSYVSMRREVCASVCVAVEVSGNEGHSGGQGNWQRLSQEMAPYCLTLFRTRDCNY